MILTLDGLKYLGWIATDTDSVMLHTVPSEIYLKHLRGRYQHRSKGKSLRRHHLKSPSERLLLTFHLCPLSAESAMQIKAHRTRMRENTQIIGQKISSVLDERIETALKVTSSMASNRKEYRNYVPNP